MATCFDRWKKDSFFSAAEEVQESADRMESVYRRWIHERKDLSNTGDSEDAADELLRDLLTALSTAKWQLEELERAVRSNDEACSAGEYTRARHSQFVAAIGNQILMVENSLRQSNHETRETKHTWIRLDEGERDELALFLSCSLSQRDNPSVPRPLPKVDAVNSLKKPLVLNEEAGVDFLKKSCRSNELGRRAKDEERGNGHRRTASACADLGVWKISVSSEDEVPNHPPPKTPSFSSLAKAFESTSKVKWPKNAFRKWKGGDQHQADESETIPLRNHQLSGGINVCYEKSKSCLSTCGDEVYDKQLYGWIGALQRQLQRSHYQIQYGRPIQMIFWGILIVMLIVLFALRAI